MKGLRDPGPPTANEYKEHMAHTDHVDRGASIVSAGAVRTVLTGDQLLMMMEVDAS